MTDNEVVKALECCVGEPYTCDQCPYQEIKHYDYDNNMFEIMPNGIQYDQWSCDRWLLIDLLDLINRLQAEANHLDNESDALLADIDFRDKENKKLQAENENLKDCIDEQDIEISRLWKMIDEAKAEAYKEFAEKLDNETFGVYYASSLYHVVDIDDVKEILKELVGDYNRND